MSNEISITPEQKQQILGYQSEAFDALSEAEAAMERYKEIVNAASETTTVSKKIVGKYFKTKFNEKVKEMSEEAEIIQFLAE